MLIQSHRDTLARATKANTALQLAALDSLGKGVCEVGIIDRLLRVAAEIYNLEALGCEVAYKKLLKLVCRVVAGDTNFLLQSVLVF